MICTLAVNETESAVSGELEAEEYSVKQRR